MVGWSLVKLSSAMLHLFLLIDESSCGTCFAVFRKIDFTCYPLLLFAFIFMMSLILFRHFGRRYPVLSGQMHSYHVVRKPGHLGSILWIVTSRIRGDGNGHIQQSPESPLVYLVSWRQAFTSIVICHSLQILDCCGLGALVDWKSPYSLSFSITNSRTMPEGFMLAIDIASTCRLNSLTG